MKHLKRMSIPIPKVERIIEFSDEDFKENIEVTASARSLITKEDWEKFEDNSLVVVSGNDVYQYAEEFPIVVYRSSEEDESINAFVEKIVVSTADLGKRFSLKKWKMKEEFTGPDTVAYFEDSFGRNIVIDTYDVSQILFKKPKAVLSSEGIIIFFTEREILATTNCEHYAWVNDIDTENAKIKSIGVCNGYCIVNLQSTEETDENDDGEKVVSECSYKLQFDIDMLSRGLIIPKVTNKKVTKKEDEEVEQ